jgi:DNA-binding NarL/FixJ family response regulator
MSEVQDRSAVLLDPHPLWLDAMEKLLTEVGITVVGRATAGDEAVALVEALRPDIFVAGVDVGCAEQVTCIARAKQSHPDVKAVVVDDSTNPEEIDVAFAAGAAVYCVKTARQDDLASAIRQVFERSIYLATGGTPSAVSRPSVSAEAATRDLTRRELEILRLVAEGSSNSQLAKMLWVTEQTVKFHLSNIYRKLEVANRTEASRWAQVHGLLSPDPEFAASAAA